MNITNWFEDTTVLIASIPDKYNQCSYTTTNISGRLVYSQFEVRSPEGEILTAQGKFFTLDSTITENSTIAGFKVFKKKEVKDKSNVVQFYKYELI